MTVKVNDIIKIVNQITVTILTYPTVEFDTSGTRNNAYLQQLDKNYNLTSFL